MFWVAFRKWRQYRLIADTPTSTVRSIAMGLVEICGVVMSKATLLSPFSDTVCVYFRYLVEEYRRKVSRNSKGKTSVSYRWETIRAGDKYEPFFTRDDTGQVWVDPYNAEFNISQKRVFYQQRGLGGGISVLIGAIKAWTSGDKTPLDTSEWKLEEITNQPARRWRARVGDRRMTEYLLCPDDTVYVLGTAANDDAAPDNILIRQGENEQTFIISDSSEKALLKSLRNTVMVLFLIGTVAITVGVILLWRQAEGA
jgi:hypothetical protein